MKEPVFGFIGLGLIGGSVAKALRRALPKACVLACDAKEETLNQALAEGVVHRAFKEVDAAFFACDCVFLCVPVEENEEILQRLKKVLSPACLLTDAGSVKSDIHRQIDALSLSPRFIGGHPMAGSERTGYRNSRAELLENAYYILTPSAQVPEERVAAFKELVVRMKAIPLVLSPKRHDHVTAAVSHLPHILAASLVNLVRASDSPDETMKRIAAGGFKDITRIASSSPELWRQICLGNSGNILPLLDDYICSLQGIREQLREKDGKALYRCFNEARLYRDSFIDASSGPIKKSCSITVDIRDETGALASIATLLALNGISIKNIGILHNREYEEGVLRIEFYDETSVRTAVSILTDKGYAIYEKR